MWVQVEARKIMVSGIEFQANTDVPEPYAVYFGFVSVDGVIKPKSSFKNQLKKFNFESHTDTRTLRSLSVYFHHKGTSKVRPKRRLI